MRFAILAALSLPLFASGPCVQLSENAAIDGFFNALTTVLVDRLSQELGLTTGATTDPTGSPAGP